MVVADPGGASATTIDGRAVGIAQGATGLRLDLGQPDGPDPVAIVLAGVRPAPSLS